MSTSKRILYISFSRIDSGLCIDHLSVYICLVKTERVRFLRKEDVMKEFIDIEVKNVIKEMK